MRPNTSDHGGVSLHHRRESHFKLCFGVTCSPHDGLGLLTPGHKVLVLVDVGNHVVHFLHSKPGGGPARAERGQKRAGNQTSEVKLFSRYDWTVTQVSYARSTPSFCWWDWWSFCFGEQSSLCPNLEGKALWEFLSSKCHMTTSVWKKVRDNVSVSFWKNLTQAPAHKQKGPPHSSNQLPESTSALNTLDQQLMEAPSAGVFWVWSQQLKLIVSQPDELSAQLV